jgi:hypothetical protein
MLPAALDTNCPHCGRSVTFLTAGHQYDETRETAACSSDCPACRGRIHVWVLHPQDKANDDGSHAELVSMFPKGVGRREPALGTQYLPARVQRSYNAAIKAYNGGVLSALAPCCRRVVEGMASGLLAENDACGPLAKQVAKLSAAIDLERPLKTLARSLAEGGLAAHLEDDQDPDLDAATAMLDLVEQLLIYVYMLPGAIEQHEVRLTERVGADAAPAGRASGNTW